MGAGRPPLRRVYVSAARRFQADNMSSVGKGVAYGAFFAIPSAMIVALGVLNLTAGPEEIDRLVNHLDGVVPQSALELIRQNLHQVSNAQGGGLLVVVGFLLALFSLTGAVQTAIWGMNVAYERREHHNFVRQRLIALVVMLILVAALVAVFAVLVLAPYMTGWIGSATGQQQTVSWVWWTLQWPALFAVLLVAFAAILFRPRRGTAALPAVHPGAIAAAVLWLVGSALFGLYAAGFSSYNKSWGSLAGVIITLTWLWLCGVSRSCTRPRSTPRSNGAALLLPPPAGEIGLFDHQVARKRLDHCLDFEILMSGHDDKVVVGLDRRGVLIQGDQQRPETARVVALADQRDQPRG